MIDYTINLGNLLQIAVIIGAGFIILVRQVNSLAIMKANLIGVQNEIAKLSGVMTSIAVADSRLQAVEKDMWELRRGRGWIRDALKGEYDERGHT